MQHVKAVGVKLVAHIVLALVILTLLFDIDATHSIIIALIVGVGIYILGDLIILRKIGNIVATVADAGSAFLITWLYLNTTVDGDWLIASLVFGLLVGVFEWFFHGWLLKQNVVPDERSMK